MYDPETTGSLQRIRDGSVLRDAATGELSTYTLEGDRSHAAGVYNATGQYPGLPTREYPVLPASAVTGQTQHPAGSPAENAAADSSTASMDVGRHRRVNKNAPRNRMIGAIGLGLITSGVAIIYSQYPNLPEAWDRIVDYFN